MDITVNRNAYGRQNDSFETTLNLTCENIKNEGEHKISNYQNTVSVLLTLQPTSFIIKERHLTL